MLHLQALCVCFVGLAAAAAATAAAPAAAVSGKRNLTQGKTVDAQQSANQER